MTACLIVRGPRSEIVPLIRPGFLEEGVAVAPGEPKPKEGGNPPGTDPEAEALGEAVEALEKTLAEILERLEKIEEGL